MVDKSSLFSKNLKGPKTRQRCPSFFAMFLSLFLVFSSVDSRGFSTFFQSVSALEPFEVISIQVSGNEVKQAGETVQLIVELNEPMEQAQFANLWFNVTHDGESGSKYAYANVSAVENNLYIDFVIPQYNSNGDWSLSQMQITEYVEGNYVYHNFSYSSELTGPEYFNDPSGQFSVENGMVDTDRPTLVSLSPLQGSFEVNTCVTMDVFVSDAISFVSNVNVGVKLPNGNTTYYGTNFMSTDHYQFNYCIEPFGDSGFVEIQSIILVDAAGNHMHYANPESDFYFDEPYDFSGYSFEVFSKEYPTLPSMISIEVNPYEVIAGESTQLTVVIEDEGYNYYPMTATYMNIHGGHSTVTLYHQGEGVFVGTVQTYRHQIDAVYRLISLSMNTEGVYFSVYDEQQFPNAQDTFDLSGGNYLLLPNTSDDGLPKLDSIIVSSPVIAGTYATIDIYLKEHWTGISSVYLNYLTPYGHHQNVHATYISDTHFQANFYIDPQFADTVFQMFSLTIVDNEWNEKQYYTPYLPGDFEEYDMSEKIDLSVGDLHVGEGVSRPIIKSMSHLEPILSPNMMMNFIVEFENYNENEEIQLYFVNDKGYAFHAYGYRVDENKYQVTHYLEDWFYSGTYNLREIYLVYHGNSFGYADYESDLSAGSFELIGGVSVPNAPVIGSFVITQPSYTVDETIEVTIQFSDNFSGINYMYGQFENEHGVRMHVDLIRVDSGVYRVSKKVLSYTNSGTYELKNINVQYNSGFSLRLDKRPEDCFDCSSDRYFDESISFEVYGTVEDVTAPTLTSIEVSTNQVTLNDIISFFLEVEDDVSGIFSVEVSVMGPEGGFSTRAYLVEGNLYRADYKIQYTNKPGEYRVYAVYLNDRAENHRCYYDSSYVFWCDSYDFDGTSFNIVGDHGQLNLKNVFIETLKLQAYESSVISVEFNEPYFPYMYIGVEFMNDSGDSLYTNLRKMADGLYRGEIFPYVSSDNGIYTLNRITVCGGDSCMELLHGNPEEGSQYTDLSIYQIEVYGNIQDEDDPVLLGSSISKNQVTINDKLVFHLDVYDETSIVTGGEMVLVHLETRREIYFSFNFNDWVSNGAFIYVNKYMAPGEWAVLNIVLRDSKDNRNSYFNMNEAFGSAYNENYINLDHLNFTVFGTILDSTPPQILDMQIENTTLSRGGYGKFTMNFIEAESGFQSMHLVYVNKSTREPFWVGGQWIGGNQFEFYVPNEMMVGEYELHEIEIVDRMINVNNYCNSQSTVYVCQSQSLPLGHMSIEVTEDTSGFSDYTEMIESVSYDHQVYLAGQEVKMSVTLSEELWFAPRMYVYFRTIGSYSNSFMIDLKMAGNGVYEGSVTLDMYTRWGESAIIESIYMYADGRDVQIINKDLLDQWSGVQYIADFSEASFSIVQDFFDETPPVFHQLVLESKTYEQRNIVPMQVWASDDESNVRQVVVRFRVAGTNERYDFYSEPDFINQNLFKSFFLYLSGWYRQGLWEVDRITITNKYGLNTIVYNEKFYPLMENVQNFDSHSFVYSGGQEDYLPPELVSVEKDKSVATKDEIIGFRLQAVDNMSGVNQAVLTYRLDGNRYFQVELRKQLDDSFYGELVVGEFMKPGVYKIEYIFLSDNAGNHDLIFNSDRSFSYQYPDFSFMDIEIIGTLEDHTRSNLVGYEISTKQALIGEVFELTLDIFEEESGVDWIHVSWAGKNSWIGQSINVEKGHTGPITMLVPIHTNVRAGVFEIAQIIIQDRAGNWSEYFHSEKEFPQYRLLDFSELSIEVFGETQEVIIESIEISNQALIPNDILSISMDILDNILKPDQAVVHYVSDLGQTLAVVLLSGSDVDYMGYHMIGEFDTTAT